MIGVIGMIYIHSVFYGMSSQFIFAGLSFLSRCGCGRSFYNFVPLLVCRCKKVWRLSVISIVHKIILLPRTRSDRWIPKRIFSGNDDSNCSKLELTQPKVLKN